MSTVHLPSQIPSAAPSIKSEETANVTPTQASASASTVDVAERRAGSKKDLAFWLIMLALATSSFLSAIDLTSVSTALPTIIDDLHGGDDFVWVGSAYSLASTAILPFAGNAATIFGRQSSMLAFLVFFAIGSAMSAASPSMAVLIAGRTVQGLGGGGILALTEIIVADLVTLRERGLFMGILGAVWAFASAVGPPVGGALAQGRAWRWLFYLNLPLTAIAFALVLRFMRLKKPEGSLRAKLARVDWIGNSMMMTASTLTIVALVEGGVQHPWNSYQILVPLIIGIVGMAAYIVYEARWAKEPTLPFDILSNRTSLSGYAGTFVHGLVVGVVVFYLPVYFQASKLASPIRSSIDMFPTAFTIAPLAIINGASVVILKHYKVQNIIAWVFVTVGAGLLSILTADSSVAAWAGYQVLISLGVGILFSGTTFPVLAPLPVTKNAHALAFFTFVRSFAQTFGVTIGSTVLQNELSRLLPAAFTSLFPAGVDIAYAAIPQIPSLPQPMQDEVRVAFASSLSTLWKVLIGIGAAGFVTSLFMKHIELHEVTDDAWGMIEQEARVVDEEKAAP